MFKMLCVQSYYSAYVMCWQNAFCEASKCSDFRLASPKTHDKKGTEVELSSQSISDPGFNT